MALSQYKFVSVNDGPGGPRAEMGSMIWKGMLAPVNADVYNGKVSHLVDQGRGTHPTDNDALPGELAVYAATSNTRDPFAGTDQGIPLVSTNPKQVGTDIPREMATKYPLACEWLALAPRSYAGVVGGAGASIMNPSQLAMGFQMKKGLLSVMNSVQHCQRSYAGQQLMLALPIQKDILHEISRQSSGGRGPHLSGDVRYTGSPTEPGIGESKVRYVTREISARTYARALHEQLQLAAHNTDEFKTIMRSMGTFQQDYWYGAVSAIQDSALTFGLSFLSVLLQKHYVTFAAEAHNDFREIATPGTNLEAFDSAVYGPALLAKLIRLIDTDKEMDREIEEHGARLRKLLLGVLFPLDGNIDPAPPAGVRMPDEAYPRDASGMPTNSITAQMETRRGRHVDDMLYAFAQINDYMLAKRVGTVVTPGPFGHKQQVLTL